MGESTPAIWSGIGATLPGAALVGSAYGAALAHPLSLLGDHMQIIAALFIEDIDVRQVEGPSTRIDLGGVQFSAVAPTPLPLTWAPHLVVIVHAAPDSDGTGVLEVVYKRDGEQIARNVQPLQTPPGKFDYRLVRGEIDFEEYGTIEAHCRIGTDGHVIVVPYTLLPPAAD